MPECEGLGVIREIDESLIIPDRSLSVRQGAIKPYDNPKAETWFYLQMETVLKSFNFDFDTPIRKLTPKAYETLLQGTGKIKHNFFYYSGSKKKNYKGVYKGVMGIIRHYFDSTTSDHIRNWAEEYMSEKTCPACNGGRLKKEALSYKINDLNIHDAVNLSVLKRMLFFFY